jgi:hypothetical protein
VPRTLVVRELKTSRGREDVSTVDKGSQMEKEEELRDILMLEDPPPPKARPPIIVTRTIPLPFVGLMNEPTAPPGLDYPDSGHNLRTDTMEKESEYVDTRKRSTAYSDYAEPHDNGPPTIKRRLVRPTSEVLADVVLNLHKLRYEVGVVFDADTAELAEKVERDTRKLRLTKILKEEREKKEKRREELRRIRDRDGDVEMGDYEMVSKEDPVREPRPTAPSQDDPQEAFCKEIFKQLRMIQGEVLSLQWKKVDGENSVEDRLDILEGKMAARDHIQRTEEELPPNPKRRQCRDAADKPPTKAATQKMEARVEGFAKDLGTVKGRLSEVERVQEEATTARRRINEVEKRIMGVERELLLAERRIADLEGKPIEGTHDLKAQAISQERAAFDASMMERLLKLEEQGFNLNYRFITFEEQAGWSEQKLHAVQAVAESHNTEEAYKHLDRLRKLRIGASAAYRRRIFDGVTVPPSSRTYIQGEASSVFDEAGSPVVSPVTDPPVPTQRPASC